MPRFEDDDEEMLWEDDADDDEEEDVDEGDDDLSELIEITEELVETGEAKKAIRLWRRSIDRFADEPLAFYHQGLAAQRYLEEELGGRKLTGADTDLLPFYDLAVSAFEEVVSMEPENTDALNALGHLHATRGRAKMAREAWEKSLEIKEDQDDIRAELEDL